MMLHTSPIPTTAPEAMTTRAIVAEINSRGPMLDAAAKRMNPDEWVKAGNKIFDFKLNSGKRLGSATWEDLDQQCRLEQNLAEQNERQAALYEELANRLPVKDPQDAALMLHLSS